MISKPFHVVLSCTLLLIVSRGLSETGSAVYLYESFDAMALPSGWSINQIVGPSAAWSFIGPGTNPLNFPYAGPGQAKFNSFDAGSGEQARLVSRRIDLSSAVDPFVAFSLYHDDEFIASTDSLIVEITAGDSIAGPWVRIGSFIRPGPSNEWKTETIALFSLIGQSQAYIGLRAVSQYGNNMYLDEFLVADSSFHDIGPLAALPQVVSLPTQWESRFLPQGSKETAYGHFVARGQTDLEFVVPVKNFGSFDEGAYQVRWTINGLPQSPAANSQPLMRNAVDSIVLFWLQPTTGSNLISVWTDLVGDQNPANDSVQLSFEVIDSSVVFLETFNDSVFPPAGWSTINRDGGTLTPWFSGTTSSAFPPFEGPAFAANNFQRANGQYIDDYLISPSISGVRQPGLHDSLVFYTRSVFNAPPTENFADSLMILLSTTGIDTTSFSVVLDHIEVPKTSWTRKSYRIDSLVATNSTVHVAFRYLHFAGGPTGTTSDFIGIDAVQVIRRIPSDVSFDLNLPSAFVLNQNFPNPFNPLTTISFSLPSREDVTIHIVDILGREIDQIHSSPLEKGHHSLRWAPSASVASGIYFLSFRAGSFSGTRKMLLVR